MANLRDEFPAVFSGGGSRKPHSAEYSRFSQDWSFHKVIFEMANESYSEISVIRQDYLTNFLFYLTYLIKKGEVDGIEDQFQENLRKSRKRK